MTLKLYLGALCIVLSIQGVASADGQPRNWPLPPAELERRLSHDSFTIREAKDAGAGVTGASKLKLEYADGEILKAKWKAVPGRSADGWNNSPRKELAAYAIQRWIVDDTDFLVPTIAPRCIPMADYRIVSKDATPSYANTACVLGVLAVWLDEVTTPDKFYYPKRFASDPKYARSMADFNLLTYLFNHRDGRQGNLLLSTVPGDPRVFAIDNGIAFEGFPWNFFVPNWYKIRVPWLNRSSIERLRKIDQATVRELGVIAELASDKGGILQVTSSGPNLDPKKGVRVRDGRVQFGLTTKEIDALRARVARLLKAVDSGKQPVR